VFFPLGFGWRALELYSPDPIVFLFCVSAKLQFSARQNAQVLSVPNRGLFTVRLAGGFPLPLGLSPKLSVHLASKMAAQGTRKLFPAKNAPRPALSTTNHRLSLSWRRRRNRPFASSHAFRLVPQHRRPLPCQPTTVWKEKDLERIEHRLCTCNTRFTGKDHR
jgi:hypothetical protein